MLATLWVASGYLLLNLQGFQSLIKCQQKQGELVGKAAGRKSGRTIFGSMSAEPITQQQLKLKTAAIGLFGNDVANPY